MPTATILDPVLAAAKNTVARTLAEMRESISGLQVEALNWRPGDDDTNSIAVLATHSMHSTRSWLSTAVGAGLPDRDREAEFRVESGDVQALLTFYDDMSAQCAALLEPSQTIDWAAIRRTHTRPNPEDDMKVPAAWALLHAIEHLREHLGQMQLTRQLWDARNGG